MVLWVGLLVLWVWLLLQVWLLLRVWLLLWVWLLLRVRIMLGRGGNRSLTLHVVGRLGARGHRQLRPRHVGVRDHVVDRLHRWLVVHRRGCVMGVGWLVI